MRWAPCLVVGWLLLHPWARAADVVVTNAAAFRLMAANLTGNSQKYEGFAIRIFQGLAPDVVAIQEFNHRNNTPADIRTLVDAGFGTNFVFFREAGFQLPNGIVSRFPLRRAGSWRDAEISNRGFAWAEVDLPGPRDLFLVSVHLKAGGGDADVRARQATALRTLILANAPPGAFVALAGDLNVASRNEAAMTTFRTFLSDEPVPADAAGNPNTNNGRERPYDQVLADPLLAAAQVPTVVGAARFANGLVFDSRVFNPLSAVAPVQRADSGLAQHMAVSRDYRVSWLVTNAVPAPRLRLPGRDSVEWDAIPGARYRVELRGDVVPWTTNRTLVATGSVVVVDAPAGTAPLTIVRVAAE
ncbi:MAG: endonuclease/exonuclease/phosphatase family protein [Limisphaerales bacterium]